MLIYPNDYKSALDYQRVLEFIKDKTIHERAHEAIDLLYPTSDFEEVDQRLGETQELTGLLRAKAGFPNFSFIDLQKPIYLLKRDGAVLMEGQVLSVRRASVVINELLDYFGDNPGFDHLPNNLDDVYFTSGIIREVDKIMDLHGQVRSAASRDLERIRRKLEEKRKESDRRFQSAVSRLKNQKMLRDFEETVYKNRRVLAVPAEHKRKVNGLILHHSANQLTAYIEPQGNIKLNLEIDELVEEERREIFKVLRALTQHLRKFTELIIAYDRTLLNFELIRAKAKFALQVDAVKPRLVKGPGFKLENAYHPLLKLTYESLGKKVIPLDLTLDNESKVVVISGPNAGGKSVALKTMGLIQLMVQTGIPVPVGQSSEVGIFEKIFVDVGDTQSIEYELSTYSSKLNRLKRFLEECDGRSLFLVDEFGTGTDPELGGALAESILNELVKKKSFGVVTTHYANIKRFAEETGHVVNANMQFDMENLLPRYQVQVGMPGSSYTFEVAHNTGLPGKLIERAKKNVDQARLAFDQLLSRYSEKLERLENELKNAQQKQSDLDEERLSAQDLQTELETRIKKDKEQAAERARYMQFGKFLEDLLSEYEKKKNQKQLLDKLLKKYKSEKVKDLEDKKSAIRKAKKKRKPGKVKIDPSKFEVGDSVRLKNARQKGVIQNIEDGKAEVNFGFVKTIADLTDLRPLPPGKKKKK